MVGSEDQRNYRFSAYWNTYYAWTYWSYILEDRTWALMYAHYGTKLNRQCKRVVALCNGHHVRFCFFSARFLTSASKASKNRNVRHENSLTMKTVIQVRNPRDRVDCLAVVQLTARNFAAEVRGSGQTPEQYVDIETDELYSNTDLWPQIGEDCILVLSRKRDSNCELGNDRPLLPHSLRSCAKLYPCLRGSSP